MSVERKAVERALAVGGRVHEDGDFRGSVMSAILDGLAVGLAGYNSTIVHNLRDRSSARAWRCGEGATLLSGDANVAPEAAAFLNGVALHAYDYDDTHDAAIVHTMAAILPAALAAAEVVNATGIELLKAVADGVELACNLGLASTEYSGWHYTTLCGSLGAALAASSVSGADVETVEAAVGNAYAVAGGNKQVVLDGSTMKRLMPGAAARSGVTAMHAAEAGVTVASKWLLGDYGLFAQFFANKANERRMYEDDIARIEQLSFKPYPACRFTHGAIEAAIALRTRLIDDGVEPARLGRVDVHYPDLERFALVCRPYVRRGSAVMDAQFSTAYLVARALVDGRVDLFSFHPDALSDPVVGQLANQVRVTRDLAPMHDRSLGPIVVSAAGQVERVEHVLGSPERPLDAGTVREKLEGCIRWAKADARTEVGPEVASLLQATHGLKQGGMTRAFMRRVAAVAS